MHDDRQTLSQYQSSWKSSQTRHSQQSPPSQISHLGFGANFGDCYPTATTATTSCWQLVPNVSLLVYVARVVRSANPPDRIKRRSRGRTGLPHKFGLDFCS